MRSQGPTWQAEKDSMNVARRIISGPSVTKRILLECQNSFELRYTEAFGDVVVGASEAYYLRINSAS